MGDACRWIPRGRGREADTIFDVASWMPTRVATYGDILYTDHTTVHNISDPANPVNISNDNYTGRGSNGQMVIHGDYLYFAGGDKNSNPRAWIYNIKD